MFGGTEFRDVREKTHRSSPEWRLVISLKFAFNLSRFSMFRARRGVSRANTEVKNRRLE